MTEDFLSSYLKYASDTEVPAIFHRWAAISSIGAYLGRRYYFNHGHFTINPNMYCMLVGASGTRKSTAIKLFKKLIQQAGYHTIAADKTTKEKFILDLSGEADEEAKAVDTDSFLDQNLWGEDDTGTKPDSEIFIMADEFNDFFGNGNVEFISLLGTLWDYSGIYRNRIKNGKSVSIVNPTVSILGGNTPTNLSIAFPPEIIGQGFFSRLLFIYGEPNGKRITFPKAPSTESTQTIVDLLRAIRTICHGAAELTPEAEEVLDRIYKSNLGVNDVRFDSYSTRRFSHLLKLCLITSAARYSKTITKSDVIYANTILSHAEHFMPKALGEFGKAKHSDVSHKIISLIEREYGVVSFKDIWKHVASDLEKMTDLTTLLQNLVAADKLQSIPGKGFLAKRRIINDGADGLIDYSLLTQEERDMSV
jgi:energy-coupling factor transporter ATP-binding protein EcfA2